MELRIYNYEAKRESEVLEKALLELNVSSSEIYYDIKEEESGLFKSKKYVIKAVIKEDVIAYSKNLLNEITKGMGININIEVQKRDNFIKFNLMSDNNSILIGRNGKTIEALQIILRQSILSKTGKYINVIVNVEEYKEKRETNIIMLSKNLAREVLKTKKPIKMDYMNSYERRLVHNALSEFKGIDTTSEGQEPNRFIIIKIKE